VAQQGIHVEASALQAPAGLSRSRTSVGSPLLRLRSDEQLVELFRAGHDEAFRVIHDRYRQRLFAYTRQMLPGSRQDAEDALQEVFVRAYSGLRANDRDLALRAWLYRVAHNRCIDELRRPAPPAPELVELVRAPVHDPIAEAERRESLRRLISDVRRLPEQQRSALLMRELAGMTYLELAAALGVSVAAVKSLLVRARVSLAAAATARETACSEIRTELVSAHDRRVRPNATARRHLRDCAGCREFRTEMRGVSRQFAALAPALGPFGLVAKALGLGGGGGAAAGSGAAVAGTSGAFAATGALGTGVSHVATLLAAAVVTTGGAIELQNTLASPAGHAAHHRAHSSAAGASATRSHATKSSTLTVTEPTAAAAPSAAWVVQSAAPATAAAPVTSPASSSTATSHVRTTRHSIRSAANDPNRLAIENGAASAAAAAAGGFDTVPTDPTATTGTSSSTPTSSTDPSGSTTATGSESQTTTPTPGSDGSGSSTSTGTSSSGSDTTTGGSTGVGGAQPSIGGTATSLSSGGSAASGH
jgi:RNA polymerase sigma factor (sigma-70 family)